MMTLNDAAAAVKGRAPKPVLRVADVTTRSYGVATARWRPLPDFLIVGTKRGGTTSLWNYLTGHPQVLPMFPALRGLKSNAFFFENLHRGEHWYRSHFATVAWRRRHERQHGRVVTGEASPYYMYGPHIPRLVHEINPDVRLIVLLREPVARAYGHYQERCKQGVEHLSFEDALAAEPARLAGEWRRMERDPGYYSQAYDFFAYRDRGIYLPQLQRLFEWFPPEQVLVLRSEDLYADAQVVFDQTCRFLGIRPMPIARPERHNYIPRQPMNEATAGALAAFYAPHNDALYRFLGRDLGWRSPPGLTASVPPTGRAPDGPPWDATPG